MSIRLVLIIGLAAASSVAAEIYKTVDANGNVVFTDIAPVDRAGQPAPQPVTVPPMNTYDSPTESVPVTEPDDDTTAPTYYSQLIVTSPAADEAVRDNAGNVEVQVAVTPALRAGHRMLLVFDGEPTEIEAVSGTFQLTNVDRGTHTAGARVVNRRGDVLIESAASTFNLMRVAVTQPPPIPTPHN